MELKNRIAQAAGNRNNFFIIFINTVWTKNKGSDIFALAIWRRTQAAKGVDCKSIIQRFESARRLKYEGSTSVEPFLYPLRTRSEQAAQRKGAQTGRDAGLEIFPTLSLCLYFTT